MNNFKRKPYGFSLLEIIITLSIAAVIILFSVGEISRYFEQRKQHIFMEQLYHDVKWSRIEAILLDQKVRIEPHGDWCAGWDVIHSETTIIKTHAGIDDCKIIFSGFPASRSYFQFSPSGSSDYQNATFEFYDASKLTSKIVINQAGRVSWVSS